MGILAFADKTEVVRYTSEDGDDWIDLRKTLTKGEMNTLFNSMPDNIVRQAVQSDDENEAENIGMVVILREAPELSKALFASYAVAWSLKAPCTVESYLDLTSEASNWVDAQVMEHSQQGDPKLTSAEGKSPGKSRRASRKGTAGNES